MKSMIFVTSLVMGAAVGCSTSQVPQQNEVPQFQTEVSKPNLFDEAHRCEGVVKYQAEREDGRMRSRLTCEWTVSPDEWGVW